MSGIWSFPWGGCEKMYLNSVCVMWPDYINSLIERWVKLGEMIALFTLFSLTFWIELCVI